MSDFVTLQSDMDRIVGIFDSEIQNDNDIERVIYSPKDKQLPENAITYIHPNTITTLKDEGILIILWEDNNVDPTAPYFKGSKYYNVKVIASKVKEKLKVLNTVTRQTLIPKPPDVEWKTLPSMYLLKFDDGKKIEFSDIKMPSAQYFYLLMENHGLDVPNAIVMEKVQTITTKVQVRNLAKTLVDKIDHAELTSRITIKSEFHDAYCLLISPKP